MIDVVQEIMEHSIEHTLEINEVHLPTNTKSIHNNILEPRHGLLVAQNTDALWTYICEHFSHIPRDIAKLVPHTGVERSPLAVVLLVNLPEVSE